MTPTGKFVFADAGVVTTNRERQTPEPIRSMKELYDVEMSFTQREVDRPSVGKLCVDE